MEVETFMEYIKVTNENIDKEHICCDFAIGVAIAAIIIIAAPTHPTMLGTLTSENVPGLQLPSIVY